MTKYYKENNFNYTEETPALEPGEYRGDTWSVKKIKDHYILSFISGSLMGKLVTQKITKEEYNSAENGTFNLDAICEKYSIS